MSRIIVFIQVHGRGGILEADVNEAATVGELQEALTSLGVEIDADTHIFVGESEHHEDALGNEPIRSLKHGSRVHVCRCERIKTTVHYLDKDIEREFAPGARVRRVKEWAADKFKIDPKDAAEHVLQLCNSTDRPSSDSPLHQLTHGHECAVCFDFVPEKRVEG
jgi:hypothetical protein